MVQDKLSAFFPPVCACLEMTGARARLCPGSRHQAGLAVIWGEKGWKAEHLAVASSDASASLDCGGLHSSCGGQHSGCDCEETANWSNCGGKTLGLLSGSCQCLSGLQLVTGASRLCVSFCVKSLRFKSQNWIFVRVCLVKLSCTCCLHHASATNRSNKHQTQTVYISTSVILPNTLRWRWMWGQFLQITNLKRLQILIYLSLFRFVVIVCNCSSFHCQIQKLFRRQVKFLFPYMQSDIYESYCSPISSDHSASPLSELTSAEHIVAISLAWCVISVLSCCWGCCPVQCGETCMREGVVVTCHHVSVIVPGVSMAPSGPLSLRLAGNSWLPWRDVWYMLVWSPVLGTAYA